MKWDPEFGIWYLLDSAFLTIHGTTPRNADSWTIDVDFHGHDFVFIVHVDHHLRDAGLIWWHGEKYREFVLGKHNAHRKFPFANYCACARQDWSYRKFWLQKIRGPR